MDQSSTYSEIDVSTEGTLVDDLESMDTASIRRIVSEMQMQNEFILTETNMLEKTFKRTEPAANDHIAAAPKVDDKKERRKSRLMSTVRPTKLTVKQKCEIAQRELDDLREELDKTRNETEKQMDTIKNAIEENDEQIKDIAKYKYEFERDVIVDIARNVKTGVKYSAEKYIRFTEEKLKSKEAFIEKLRLKNAKMSDRNRKILHQLKRKEEMGEVLHEVDFNYLKIENKQYLEKIDDKNLEFTKLKLQTGETERHLNHYKESLARLVNRAEELQPEIKTKEDMLAQLRDEIIQVDRERKKMSLINQKLKKQQADYEVPPVFDYVQQTAKHAELKKTVKEWQRKVDIAEMASKSMQKRWRTLTQQYADILMK